MKWLAKIPENLRNNPFKRTFIALLKSFFVVLLPFWVFSGTTKHFANVSTEDYRKSEQQYLIGLLSEISGNSEPERYFGKEFKALADIPFPSEVFNKRLEQILTDYPDALSVSLYDTGGAAIALPFLPVLSKVVSQRYLECVKDPSLTSKYERFLIRFSGYAGAHRILGAYPNSVVSIGTAHDNHWGGWFQLKDESGNKTGEFIVFIGKKGVSGEKLVEKAIMKARLVHGKNYRFAWQNPVFPDELMPPGHGFPKDAIDTVKTMPYGENVFSYKNQCGGKIFSEDGAAIIGLRSYPIEVDSVYSMISLLLTVTALISFILLIPVFLGITSFVPGLKLKMSALIIFGVNLPLALLLITGVADREEREKILVNNYEQQNILELNRIDEAILSDYRAIENDFKRNINRFDISTKETMSNSVIKIMGKVYRSYSFISRIIVSHPERGTIFSRENPEGRHIDIDMDSIANYGNSLIKIINGEYIETTDIEATDKNSVLHNMGGWMSRFVLLNAGKINAINMLSNASLAYTDFVFDDSHRSWACVFIFIDDFTLQGNYLYKISKLRDEQIRRLPDSPRFAAIPVSIAKEWRAFPKRKSAEEKELANLAEKAYKSRIPAHTLTKIRGEKYLISAVYGSNLSGYSLLMARPYRLIAAEIEGLKKQLSILAMLILFMALLAAYFASSLLIRPVGILKNGLESIAAGDLRKKLPDSPVEEFSTMVSSLNNTMYQLQELKVAKNVQETLWPDKGLSGENYELYGKCSPATELGGDHIDWLELEDKRLLIVIGDVTGHGVAPAMVQASVKVWLALFAQKAVDSVSLVKEINRLHITHGAKKFFMTAWFGYYTPDTGELEFTSAGHPYPLLVKSTGETEMVKVPGMPIGSSLKIRLKSEKRVLEPGSSLILYTDGFAEVQNASGKMLGFEGFTAVCASTAGMKAQDAVENIFSKVALWGEQNDDQTVIILQRKSL